eukprot:CAMPEP_0178446484 /NCGR_PEP_ID=MMETSP0689_2-20121128/40830_1 /TAXON_ID=160604 /ORGANISM="Amphidinium massartii, Strain CS-259" /LENGTH=195 /DNA_ID=CAMNT_0020071315 /DNA_START=66 /DNA_END=649 /DNA_ORIENTATION=-
MTAASDARRDSFKGLIAPRGPAVGSQARRRAMPPKPKSRRYAVGGAAVGSGQAGPIGQCQGHQLGHLPLAHLPPDHAMQAGRREPRTIIGAARASPPGEPLGMGRKPSATHDCKQCLHERACSLPSQRQVVRNGHALNYPTWSIASPRNSQQGGGVAVVELFDLACDDSSDEEFQGEDDAEWATEVNTPVYSDFP